MANTYDVLGPRFQPNQVVNWGSCTAEEILEYEEQGQEVPEQYLSWAEEMSASMNAQDNVTYEMAQAENGGNVNSAADFRQQMEGEGISLKQQGKIFTEESKNKEELTLQSIEQMAPLLNVPEELENEANQVAQETRTQLEVLKAEIEASADKKDNKLFKNRAERGEIQGLEAVAKALGAQANAELEGISQELEEVDKIINTGAASSNLSVDYGQETVKVGAELVGRASDAGKIIGGILGFAGGGLLGGIFGSLIGGLFGGSKRRIGKEAIEQGSQTMTVGNQGKEIAEQAADIHGVSIKSVEQAKDDLKTTEDQNATSGEQGGETAPETGVQAPTTGEAEQDQTQTIAEQDPSVLVTDPNEILKRKERKGLA